MKNLIFAALLLTSFSANASYFDFRGYPDSPVMWNGGAGCSNSTYKCYAGVNGYTGPTDSIGRVPNSFLSSGVGNITTDKDVNAKLTWSSFNLRNDDITVFLYSTEFGRLYFSTLSGTYDFIMKVGEEYAISIFANQQPYVSTMIDLVLTGVPIDQGPDIIETPIPAPFFLLLPFTGALLLRSRLV